MFVSKAYVIRHMIWYHTRQLQEGQWHHVHIKIKQHCFNYWTLRMVARHWIISLNIYSTLTFPVFVSTTVEIWRRGLCNFSKVITFLEGNKVSLKNTTLQHQETNIIKNERSFKFCKKLHAWYAFGKKLIPLSSNSMWKYHFPANIGQCLKFQDWSGTNFMFDLAGISHANLNSKGWGESAMFCIYCLHHTIHKNSIVNYITSTF